MRGMNCLPLDDDIVDRVLLFLPDYSTLLAAILSSKSFYKVFKAHPKSIICSVSYNITGPALPQALRVIRYVASSVDNTDQTHSQGTLHSIPWSENDSVLPITDQECRQLAENAKVVNALEDLFSFRHKDRNFSTSVLDSAESCRFRKAMYRLMLYAKVFSVEDEDADLDEEDDEFDEMLQRERLARSKLLRDFATSELYELHSAAHFLVEIAQWADTAFQQQRTWYPSVLNLDNVLPAGPEAVLVAYREKSYLEMDEPMNQQIFSGFLHEPLKTVLEERKAKPPQEMSTHWTSLVDGARGANDTCKSIFLFKFIEGRHKCGATCGLDLWNETNWYYLSGLSSSFGRPVRLSLLSKGTSSLNFFYGFGRFPGPEHGIGFDQALSSSTYESILNEIHQIRVAPWNDWGKGDWLCERCIKGIFEAHLHLWLLERKRAAGDVIKEDCWYGYHCRTQRGSAHHAGRLNTFLPHMKICMKAYMNLDSAWITNRVTCDASRHKKLNDVTLLQVKTSTIFVREVLFYMSQVDEPSFFERERDRLARDITASFEELLSSTNGLNRKLEEVLGMTKEYDTIAELWQSFYHLMRGPVKDADDSQDEKMGLPGTGGHVVAMKQSKS